MTDLIKEAKAQGKKVLTEIEAKDIFRAAGIPVVKTYLAASKEEAQMISSSLGFPVALKICSTDILHKTEAGGVFLNLACAEEVGRAYDQILEMAMNRYPLSNIEGVTVQEMVVGGVEVVVGMTRDPQFGFMIMFGIGGIFVEILKDVSFRIVPLNEEDAWEMISEIKGRALLEGVRGTMPVKKEALVEILVKLSRFIEENPEIIEMDINPLFANSRGAVAADARIIME
ncbi:MAG: acetate--CoA ligase family protein [Bacillota bacterium]|nr:acetate--CoA ligase family protein [Bacillota bacterium]